MRGPEEGSRGIRLSYRQLLRRRALTPQMGQATRTTHPFCIIDDPPVQKPARQCSWLGYEHPATWRGCNESLSALRRAGAVVSHGDLIPVIPQVLGCWDAGTGALVSGGDTGAGAEPLLGTRVREQHSGWEQLQQVPGHGWHHVPEERGKERAAQRFPR